VLGVNGGGDDDGAPGILGIETTINDMYSIGWWWCIITSI
jgi:hypothetical protein